MNDFEMYKMILEIIADKNPKDLQALLDESQHYQIVKDYIASDKPNSFLIQNIQEMALNMINDDLISATISPLKYVTLIKFNGLTVLGFQYLKKLKEQDTKQQIESILNQEGHVMSAKNLTEILSKLIFS